jgi:hypothetical protein
MAWIDARTESDMDTPQTCGRGLAEHSPLPLALAKLTDSVRVILEAHTTALDLSDAASKKELEVYRELANQHRDAAAQLHTIATEMAAHRDLPMGRHNLEAMAAPTVANAFETFVNLEQDVMTLLESRLARDRQMLTDMRAADNT